MNSSIQEKKMMPNGKALHNQPPVKKQFKES